MRHSGFSTALVLFAFLALGFVGCGGDSTPVKPTPTATSVTLTTFSDILKVKETAGFAATAAHSDGTSAAVTSWFSDTPTVATVQATTGLVTGVAPGLANIVAEHDGMRGIKLVRVVPNFQGRWDGDYAVTSCNDSGAFTGFCKDFSVDKVLPTTLNFTQNRDVVDGTLSLGQLTGSAHGPIGQNAVLSLSDIAIQSGDFKVMVTMANFTIDANDRMQGTFRTTWTNSWYSGDARFDARLRVVVRTSSGAAPTSMRFFAPTTLQDVIAAVMTRQGS